MTVYDIITGALQRIPAVVRQTLLVVFALAVIGLELARIFELEAPYAKIDRALLYVGAYLGVQSAANVRRPVISDHDDLEDHAGLRSLGE